MNRKQARNTRGHADLLRGLRVWGYSETVPVPYVSHPTVGANLAAR